MYGNHMFTFKSTKNISEDYIAYLYGTVSVPHCIHIKASATSRALGFFFFTQLLSLLLIITPKSIPMEKQSRNKRYITK